MCKHQRFLDICYKYSIKNKIKGKFTLTALIAKGSKIIIEPTTNIYQKTHPLSPTRGLFIQSVHAELRVLSQLKVLKGKEILYINGVTRGGNILQTSKPCKDCQELISSYNIKTIYQSKGKIKVL